MLAVFFIMGKEECSLTMFHRWISEASDRFMFEAFDCYISLFYVGFVQQDDGSFPVGQVGHVGPMTLEFLMNSPGLHLRPSDRSSGHPKAAPRTDVSLWCGQFASSTLDLQVDSCLV